MYVTMVKIIKMIIMSQLIVLLTYSANVSGLSLPFRFHFEISNVIHDMLVFFWLFKLACECSLNFHFIYLVMACDKSQDVCCILCLVYLF
jgi:hypothetical protein